MMVYWELTWLWGHQKSFKENIKTFSYFQLIYYSKIMRIFFLCVYKLKKRKMWQWQSSNDYVLISKLADLNFQQIITTLPFFKRTSIFCPNVVLNIFFAFLITFSIFKCLFWWTGKPGYQEKEVRGLFLYFLPLFSIQTWQIFTFKIKCNMNTAQWGIFCNVHILSITLY